MFTIQPIYCQKDIKKDTIKINESIVDEEVFYSAKDSIITDYNNQQVKLYGDAQFNNGEISIKACFILVDFKKDEIYANYCLDKDSIPQGIPEFNDGIEEVIASSIKYNFRTKKGFIKELELKQNETYLFMETAKRHNNEQIHFKNGRFTTCDLDEPHYHFQLSKAVMIPDERIVTGPMNLWIKGVPTPIGLPFAVIPQQKERTHGILFPEIIPLSAYGFGFQNLGYFFPINDNFQTSAYVNLYSRGSWGLRNVLDYAKRYGFRGNIDVGFQQFKSGFPENSNLNKFSINWIHRKELKSNPNWNFSSNVNFISDNNSKNNLDPLNPQYFNNSFNSDINLNRNFVGKPVNMGMKLSVRQNSISQNISLVSPVFNLNVTRVFPFSNLTKSNKGLALMIKRIGVTYNFEGQNKSTFKDSLLRDAQFNEIGKQFLNGFYHNVGIQTTGSFFRGTLKFNPSLTYSGKLNFQQIEKSYDALNNSTIIDTISKSGITHELSINAQFTTVVYAYYKFIGKKKPILRHLLTPNIGFRYVPQINEYITENVGPNQQTITYSPYERSVYASSVSSDAGLITFGINNTFELKRKSDKDTVTGFKKTFLIDQLSLTGNYDLFKDSMKLSDLNLSLRINPTPWLNIVGSSSFSPYGWVDSTGKTIATYALNSNASLGRFTRNDITTTFSITSKQGRKEIEKSKESINDNWNADFNYFALHPEYLVNFNIPWKLNFSHVYAIQVNTNKSDLNPDQFIQLQTLVLNGDVSFTKRWNLSTTLNLDMNNVKVTNARLMLSRNLHCWALSLFWTPIGGNKSFLLSIRNTSSIFSAAKLEFRKPPVFL